MREFGFELSLCAHLEAAGTPGPEHRDSTPAIVARQLGGGVARPGGRVLDTVLVEPGPSYDERTAITSERIPQAAIDAALGPGRARRVTNAFDCRPDRARSIAEHAAEIGFLELERRSGQLHARQTARYPSNWFGEIVGIENKPDLGTPGALEAQLRTDVSLGLVDRIVLATESYVTGAHRNRIPDGVGIWRFDPGAGDLTVLREAAELRVDEPGVEILDQKPGRSDVTVVAPDEKFRARRRIAERAYGKGWRTFGFPECAEVKPRAEYDGQLPWCEWKGRIVDPASECGPECPGFESADAPEVDHDADRASASPWVANPAGRKRSQVGLDRY
ncbi:DUF5787 family protein [Salinarchaeum chitinilyticum]